jgi:hypothetical protein
MEKEQETHFSATAKVEAQVETLGLLKRFLLHAGIRAEYEMAYGNSYNSTLSKQLGYDLESTEGYYTQFDVIWSVVSRTGIITFESDGEPISLSFQFEDDLSPTVITSLTMKCDKAVPIITGQQGS